MDAKIDDLYFVDGTIFAVEAPKDGGGGDQYGFLDVAIAGSDYDPTFANTREVASIPVYEKP